MGFKKSPLPLPRLPDRYTTILCFPEKILSVAACSLTTSHLHSPKEVALVGAFCAPSALNLGDPDSFSRNTSHIEWDGKGLSDTCLQSSRALSSHLRHPLQILPAVMPASLDLSSLALKKIKIQARC